MARKSMLDRIQPGSSAQMVNMGTVDLNNQSITKEEAISNVMGQGKIKRLVTQSYNSAEKQPT